MKLAAEKRYYLNIFALLLWSIKFPKFIIHYILDTYVSYIYLMFFDIHNRTSYVTLETVGLKADQIYTDTDSGRWRNKQ